MTAKGKHPNSHPFTDAGVLAYITENRGTRYKAGQLARSFKVPSGELGKVLKRLVESQQIKAAVVGTNRLYFVMSEAEMVLIRRMEERKSEFRPLVGYEKKLREFAEMAVRGRS
jgi:hypothetical protein